MMTHTGWPASAPRDSQLHLPLKIDYITLLILLLYDPYMDGYTMRRMIADDGHGNLQGACFDVSNEILYVRLDVDVKTHKRSKLSHSLRLKRQISHQIGQLSAAAAPPPSYTPTLTPTGHPLSGACNTRERTARY